MTIRDYHDLVQVKTKGAFLTPNYYPGFLKRFDPACISNNNTVQKILKCSN